MNCANDGNAYAPGGQNYNFSAAPAFRLRPDNGFGAWTRPDGHTATMEEAGKEFSGSFWMCAPGDTAIPYLKFASHNNKAGDTVWHVAQIGHYTETYGLDPSTGKVTRGEYHHFIDPRCDRLMFAQNCNFNPTREELVVPSPRWFAPKRAGAPTPTAAQRGRRPFCSPESSMYGIDGPIWESKQYADFRLQPKMPKNALEKDWWDYNATKGIVVDTAIHDGLTNGNTMEEIGILLGLGDAWAGIDPELLYTMGGTTGAWRTIYWGDGDAAESYSKGRLQNGMQGRLDWESMVPTGTSVPNFMKDPNASTDMIAAIDPDGLGVAFDLCVLFRTYHYKTRHFPTNGAPAEDVASGYYNTHCYVSVRLVAPCPPA